MWHVANQAPAEVESCATAVTSKKTRRFSQFDGRDKWIVLAMVGIPTLLHVGLVWIPDHRSILLSFTNWNGIRFSEMEWVGLTNYQSDLRRVSRRDFFQALINNTVLMLFLFIGPTAFGICWPICSTRTSGARVSTRASSLRPVVLSLAVVGFIWQSVIYSTENGLATQLFGGGDAGRLARRTSRS